MLETEKTAKSVKLWKRTDDEGNDKIQNLKPRAVRPNLYLSFATVLKIKQKMVV